MLRKLLVSTVIAGCAASALAQPSILPFVADRVNDSRFLDIPSDDVVVDIAVSISDPTDAWTAGGLSATAMNGAFFDYATDPNTGANVLARPDRDGGVLTNQEKFSTFVSQPKDRTNAPRFRGPGEAAIAGAFDPLGPVAVSDPTFVNVSYLEFPPTGLEGTGWTSRLTLDVDNVLAANGFSNANKPYIDTTRVTPATCRLLRYAVPKRPRTTRAR